MAACVNVLLVGCGNMGVALAAGCAERLPAAVRAIGGDPSRARRLLPPGTPVPVHSSAADLVAAAPALLPDAVILALKPQVFAAGNDRLDGGRAFPENAGCGVRQLAAG